MSPRPLPAHGTYARANGSPGYRPPCYCDACTIARRAAKKRMQVNRDLGRPGRIDAKPARQHLELLLAEMSYRAIARATGYDRNNLKAIHDGAIPKVNQATLRKILAVKPTGKKIDTVCIDATGTRRRLQALMAEGRTLIVIGDAAEVSRWQLGVVLNGRQATVTQSVANRVVTACRRLANAPATTDTGSARSRLRASREGWAPLAAWDDCAIDDPAALPDWTGHCGTDRGWRVHRVAGQTPCQRCIAAHRTWRSEMRRLPAAEREQAVAAALEVSGKGAAVAEDARELFDQGFTRRQAAERIGVTVDWLAVELVRNPIAEEAAA